MIGGQFAKTGFQPTQRWADELFEMGLQRPIALKGDRPRITQAVEMAAMVRHPGKSGDARQANAFLGVTDDAQNG